MKPSDQIYKWMGEQIEAQKKGGYTPHYIPGFVDNLLPQILRYLDEHAKSFEEKS